MFLWLSSQHTFRFGQADLTAQQKAAILAENQPDLEKKVPEKTTPMADPGFEDRQAITERRLKEKGLLPD